MKSLIALLAIVLATSLHAADAASARQYVDAHRAELGLDERNEVRLAPWVRSQAATYVFEQFCGGVKVRDGVLYLTPRADGSFQIEDKRVANIDLDPRPKIRYAYARELAQKRLPRMVPDDPQLLIIRALSIDGHTPDRHRLTWVVPMDASQSEVYVDAQSGEVYRVVRLLMCVGPPPTKSQ